MRGNEMTNKKRILMIWPVTMLAIVFGIMTIISSSAVLFIDGAARLAAGDYVVFVVWFNFLAGFFYVISGIGLWLEKIWAARLAIIIAALTVGVFIAFGIHIVMDGRYEMRTVIAMTFRSLIWITIAAIAIRYSREKKAN